MGRLVDPLPALKDLPPICALAIRIDLLTDP